MTIIVTEISTRCEPQRYRRGQRAPPQLPAAAHRPTPCPQKRPRAPESFLRLLVSRPCLQLLSK